jgi:agmatinase
LREVDKSDFCLICFDAHLDLRDEHNGSKVSHATVMRRIADVIGSDNILEVGTRGVSREEVEFARQSGVEYFTSREIRVSGTDQTFSRMRDWLHGRSRVAVSIDLDVLDPGFAGGVGTPEAAGISTSDLLELLSVIDDRLAYLDVVELSPRWDPTDASPFAASRTIMEACIRGAVPRI